MARFIGNRLLYEASEVLRIAQNPLRTILRNIPVDWEAAKVANLLQTCYGKTGVMDFGLIPTRRTTYDTIQ